MSVDSERKLQERVKHWLINDLHYTFLGNFEDFNNTPVLDDKLRQYLQGRGYSTEQIARAISELRAKVSNQADSLYEANRAVYSLLRYGLQGVRADQGNRPTVHYIDWEHPLENDFYLAEVLLNSK